MSVAESSHRGESRDGAPRQVARDAPCPTGTCTFVGFGFGAIQAGLFLEEAYRGGAFRRLVVAEIVPAIVDAIRGAGGRFRVNIARPTGLSTSEVGPIQIENPSDRAGYRRLVDAVADAVEIATAVPSVEAYTSGGSGSLHRVLADGLRKKAVGGGPRAVVYAAENHNHAAEILEEAVLGEVPEAERQAVQAVVRFLNTVVGKMSGAVTDRMQIEEQGLEPVTPGASRAFVVEEFNRILISRVRFEDPTVDGERFERGLAVFEEKDDLLPFEEAKLYGHNATHALAAYLGAVCGCRTVADLRPWPGAIPFLRAAFIEESGETLIRTHRGIDRLFTHEGYRDYADDLLIRMTNPHLRDTVERVGRDPRRKLGWDDRLVGTMRRALSTGVRPVRFALGTALAAEALHSGFLSSGAGAGEVLRPIWAGGDGTEREVGTLLELVEEGRRRARGWLASDLRDVEVFFHRDY